MADSLVISDEVAELYARMLVRKVSEQRYDGKLGWDDVDYVNQKRYLEEARTELAEILPAVHAEIQARLTPKALEDLLHVEATKGPEAFKDAVASLLEPGRGDG